MIILTWAAAKLMPAAASPSSSEFPRPTPHAPHAPETPLESLESLENLEGLCQHQGAGMERLERF